MIRTLEDIKKNAKAFATPNLPYIGMILVDEYTDKWTWKLQESFATLEEGETWFYEKISKRTNVKVLYFDQIVCWS